MSTTSIPNPRALLLLLALPFAPGCTRGEAGGVPRGPSLALGEPRKVTDATGVGTAPMFAVSPAGTRALAWVSAPGGGTDGRLHVSVDGAPPAEIRDPLGPIEPHGESPPKVAFAPDGSLAALYVVGKEVPGRRFPLSALRFTRSEDGGRRWSEPVTVTDDSVFGSHNFHSLHLAAGGDVVVGWLDGREGKSAAYLTRSRDGGRTWSPNRRVAAGEACPCCRTAVATLGDTTFVAWRQVFASNRREIVVARSLDGGETWGEPVRAQTDGWVFPGCPHAGPAMQVDAEGRVHVAWWSGKEGGAGVWLATSTDGGASFGAPRPLGVAAFSRPAHVQLALGAGGTVVAAWDDGTVETPRVVARVSRDGGRTFGAATVMSAEGAAATFPVLALQGDSVVVAWSEKPAASHAHAEHAKPDMRDPKARKPLSAVGDAQVIVRAARIR